MRNKHQIFGCLNWICDGFDIFAAGASFKFDLALPDLEFNCSDWISIEIYWWIFSWLINLKLNSEIIGEFSTVFSNLPYFSEKDFQFKRIVLWMLMRSLRKPKEIQDFFDNFERVNEFREEEWNRNINIELLRTGIPDSLPQDS